MSGPYGYIGPQVMPPAMGPPPMPPSASLMDPAANNAPLQFNTAKGKPPMAIPGDEVSHGVRVVDDRRMMDNGSNNSGNGTEGGDNMGMMSASMMSQMGYGPMMGPGMADPSMMMMGHMGYGNFGQYPMGPMPGMQDMGSGQKEIITLKSCVLYPPPPNAPPQTFRDRPPGCRTIFVGGLPENMSEEILREIFDSCGMICSTRHSKKNFAHIRFEMEESVDKALYISGYRIKLDNKDDKPNTGRIHVDYAQARDDLYEWECKERAMAREMRHQQRVQEEMMRPPSPPPVIHYSDHEASVLQEKLKNFVLIDGDENFMAPTGTLITWLERGDCNRRSANNFYSMVQSVNSHVRRLLNDKQQQEMEFQQIKEQFKQRTEAILRQFDQIEKVFLSATKQKAWDHFSKAQRKNIDLWKKQAVEIKRAQEDEFLKDRDEAEMDMSDSEEGDEGSQPKKKKKEPAAVDPEQYQAWMKEKENEQIRMQMEAYKNEVELYRLEAANKEEEKDKQLKALQQALQGMQQQLISAKVQIRKGEEDLMKLAKQKKEVITIIADKDDKEDSGTKSKEDSAPKSKASEEDKEDKEAETPRTPTPAAEVVQSLPAIQVSDKEARLIGVISTFLHVHPFGATLDYISSFLHRLEFPVRTSELEDLLERSPSVFKLDFHGVGVMLEKRWKFIGLTPSSL